MKTLQFSLALLLSTATAYSTATEPLTLSLTPSSRCKGAGRPAPKMPETVHARSVGAPASQVDLNGDGWCDWLIPIGAAINTGLPEYRAREAILLGTPTGARTFGKMAYLKAQWKAKRPVPEGLVLPEDVTAMAPPLVAYGRKGRDAYFAGFSGGYPEFWDLADYQVFKWNQEFDMPQLASPSEHAAVMRFWQAAYCKGKQYTNRDFMYPDQKNPERPLEILMCAPLQRAR